MRRPFVQSTGRRAIGRLGLICLMWSAGGFPAYAASEHILTYGLVTLIAILGLMYFLPAIVAVSRGHNQRGAIFWLNLFLGWTFLGWVVTFVWACMNPTVERADVAAPDDRPTSVGSATLTKMCPRCAEEVKAQAIVCRFCNHEFEQTTHAPSSLSAQLVHVSTEHPLAHTERKEINKIILFLGALMCVPLGLMTYAAWVSADKSPLAKTVQQQNIIAQSTDTPLQRFTSEISNIVNRRLKEVRPIPHNSGSAIVAFTIYRNGQVSGSRIVTSSGKEDVDNAFMTAVYSGSVILPFPNEVTQQSLNITMPMRYTIGH